LIRNGARRIDEYDVACSQAYGLIVVGHCQLAADQKDNKVVIRAVETNYLWSSTARTSSGANPAMLRNSIVMGRECHRSGASSAPFCAIRFDQTGGIQLSS
jgi:hypothetical protein